MEKKGVMLPRTLQDGIWSGVLLLAGLVFAQSLWGGEDAMPFTPGRCEQAELRYLHNVPVLIVQGTPQEMGRQKAALIGEAVRRLGEYPQRLLKLLNREEQWPAAVAAAQTLAKQLPGHHLAEMRAFAEHAGFDHDQGLVANTLVDIYRGGLGCSSLIVYDKRSATGSPLFGRNLDFYSLGILDKYTLVTVQRPQGKRAFAAVGFPGLFGVLSGINDAGLCVAVHEVYLSRDFSPLFNPQGVPYLFAARRVLEECASVAEAEKLLRGLPQTTLLNLAVCDRKGAAVFEMTPKTIAMRSGEDGLCVCTNHFRAPGLAMFAICPRYRTLMRVQQAPPLGVADVARKLNEVHLGRLTIQTMIFEPGPLVLHLASGGLPASQQPLRKLELKPLLCPTPESSDLPAQAPPSSVLPPHLADWRHKNPACRSLLQPDRHFAPVPLRNASGGIKSGHECHLPGD
jgi:predicted choloylglycine hydrolase